MDCFFGKTKLEQTEKTEESVPGKVKRFPFSIKIPKFQLRGGKRKAEFVQFEFLNKSRGELKRKKRKETPMRSARRPSRTVQPLSFSPTALRPHLLTCAQFVLSFSFFLQGFSCSCGGLAPDFKLYEGETQFMHYNNAFFC